MQTLDASVEIDAPTERVWAIVSDFASYANWNPFIRYAEGEIREGARLRITIKVPGRRAVTFKPLVLRAEPGREIRWRGTTFVRGLFDGEHALTVEPLDEGRSRFRTHEEVTGILLPVLGGIMRDTQRGFEEFARAVKARAEAASTG